MAKYVRNSRASAGPTAIVPPKFDPEKLRALASASEAFDEKKLRDLRGIGRVPEDRARALYIEIQYSILIAADSRRRPAYRPLKSSKLALNRVAKCTAALRAALGELNLIDRARLLAPHELWSPTFGNFEAAYKDFERIETAIEELEKRTERARSPKLFSPRKRGRPQGAHKNLPFRQLVGQLITTVEYSCGGKLTLSSLKDVLELLRPCLPGRFIPDPPPHETLILLLRGTRGRHRPGTQDGIACS
jgi:hypothetical protein